MAGAGARVPSASWGDIQFVCLSVCKVPAHGFSEHRHRKWRQGQQRHLLVKSRAEMDSAGTVQGACGQWNGTHPGQAPKLDGSTNLPKSVSTPTSGSDLKTHS